MIHWKVVNKHCSVSHVLKNSARKLSTSIVRAPSFCLKLDHSMPSCLGGCLHLRTRDISSGLILKLFALTSNVILSFPSDEFWRTQTLMLFVTSLWSCTILLRYSIIEARALLLGWITWVSFTVSLAGCCSRQAEGCCLPMALDSLTDRGGQNVLPFSSAIPVDTW